MYLTDFLDYINIPWVTWVSGHCAETKGQTMESDAVTGEKEILINENFDVSTTKLKRRNDDCHATAIVLATVSGF